jgi:hypothetical protein
VTVSSERVDFTVATYSFRGKNGSLAPQRCGAIAATSPDLAFAVSD